MVKLKELYLLINYCGQKIGNKYYPQKGLINVIQTELSFITIGIIIGLLTAFKIITSPIIGAIFAGLYIFLFRMIFDAKLNKKIDFKRLEDNYLKTSLFRKRFYFIISIVIFVGSVFPMVYIVKGINLLL